MRVKMLVGVAVACVVLSAGCMSGGAGLASYEYEMGLEYVDTSHSDGGTADMSIMGAGIRGYSRPLAAAGDAPLSFQPVLERASWWSFFGGTITLSAPGGDTDGDAFMFEAVAMNESGLGAAMSRGRIETHGKAFETESTLFALLADYTKGGRLSVFYADIDRDGDPAGLPITDLYSRDRLLYGASVKHLFTGTGGVSASLGYSWSRTESDPVAGVVAFESNETNEAAFMVYPVPALGVGIRGAWERGDIEDSDALGIGISLELPDVMVTVEYTKTEFDAVGAEDEESVHAMVSVLF